MLLDTSFCVDLLREQAAGRGGSATRMLDSLGDEKVAVSMFTLGELSAGAELSKHPRREHERLRAIVDSIDTLFPGARFARLYGEVVASLRRSGTPVPLMDVLIGTTARENDLAVLTRDVEHFRAIPGLLVRDY
jgi:predicted nucleic acid-binding protein